ncbi:DNA helicase [Tanacetum coccineum]
MVSLYACDAVSTVYEHDSLRDMVPLGESSKAAGSSRPPVDEIRNYLEGEKQSFRQECVLPIMTRQCDGRHLTYLDFSLKYVWPLGESSESAGSSRPPIDEIQNYLEVVQILVVHLEDMQCVTFRARDNLKSVVNLPSKKNTMLTKWFAYNTANVDGRHLTYLDFSSKYVWYADRKSWSPRQNSISSIGRLAYVHPTSGHGGTGKTFLWKTIISTLRSEEKSCKLLHHQDHKNTQLGKLLADTNLIIWDEAQMNDRRCFEALDRTLRDILDMPHCLFGGKSLLLGGDFRQTLSVKKVASKMEVIASCIFESDLWSHFKVFTLKENLRLSRPNISAEERSLVSSFASWLLDIGDGKQEKQMKKILKTPLGITIQMELSTIAQLTPFGGKLTYALMSTLNAKVYNNDSRCFYLLPSRKTRTWTQQVSLFLKADKGTLLENCQQDYRTLMPIIAAEIRTILRTAETNLVFSIIPTSSPRNLVLTSLI